MTSVLTDPPATRVHVGQGEHYVTADPTVMLTTILGSCVAMCLRDPVAGVGGMNHFLLPEGSGSGPEAGRRYGAYAMEVLINDCLKRGARRDRLEAKLFGGERRQALHGVHHARQFGGQGGEQGAGIRLIHQKISTAPASGAMTGRPAGMDGL